ncbi:NAD-dependent epimerase/dehydratase [Yersinia pseudotuberculosis]|uniref:Putative 6-deoxy-D-mannoheptose pathway protein n=1 Tax=Yersinia pseudotuberculosis TaxID=633 RepID=Q8GJ88_YERPU|nr:NAD(P)-dependent oxidoreductase [Yersinia pseudotuberculosis]AAN23071.1 putative 6-deoxy-D-mannoheptose pathway protein [Yersinia pseudotuberculosis]AIN14626.1 rmlD substrate binding domain protein [Yersinia pseudotuberculosis]AJJ06463.1 rmlD substrate binding domain protein [Yersinia pseudotuberculosis]MBO1554911.1 sugar nucleotide-binding protein [Yersinia pseudotuberculosis]MBO1562705.1 sugar nucleotide-binding protein [Yersinia pseudotuberculosis]
MTKVFILGSNGYIGNNLMESLCDNIEVITVGRSNADIYINLESDDFQSLLNKVEFKDTVIFLSAISSPDECNNNYNYSYKINVKNTISLISLLLAKNVRVMFSSSDAVFGATQNLCDENSEKKPFGKYGEMKSEVEDYFTLEDDFFVVRFSYVLGRNDKFSMMIKEFYEQGKILDVFDGFERNVISINDVTAGIKNIICDWDSIKTRIVNFSGNELVSRQDIVNALVKEKYLNLKYKFTAAPESFWVGRPKKIHTKSNYLESILNRKLEPYLEVIKE